MTQKMSPAAPEARLKELGLQLPDAPKPLASYVPFVRTGDLVYVSGQVPIRGGQVTHVGKVGAEVDVEAAQEAAAVCAKNALAVLRQAAGGSLDNVVRIVKITGFVAAAKGFTDIPLVVNGASDLLFEVFGEAGRHARAAVGAAELPLGVPVEIELIAQVR